MRNRRKAARIGHCPDPPERHPPIARHEPPPASTGRTTMALSRRVVPETAAGARPRRTRDVMLIMIIPLTAA
jgi:hypothetical protein